MEKTVLLFGALADETRLRILALLTHGELCVCQIECILQMPQSKVSRHLMVLRHAGLVSGRREAAWIHYSLPEPKDDLHARLTDCLKTCLQENPQVQADVRRIAECPPIVVKCCDGDGKDVSVSLPVTKTVSRRSRREIQPSLLSVDAVRAPRRGLRHSHS